MRLVLLVLLPVLAACASTVSGTGSAPPPRAPDGQVVFQVQPEIGGLAPQTLFRVARPVLTVYGDGTTYVADVPRNYAAPWAFRRGTIARETLTELVARADASGLFDGADFGQPQVTDTGTTSVLFHPGGPRVARTASAYALGIDDVDRQLTAGQRAHRVALRTLITRFATAVPEVTAWSPNRVEIVAPTHVEQSSDRPAPWPGPDPARLLTRDSWRGPCGVLTGPGASRVFAAALHGNTQFWTVPGGTRLLLVRALLPGEAACPA